ncbi:MAG TPA: hypothetical protein VHS31_16105 [Tepidisphaeraceae bacterium]|jgi:hypothetical protein|nr:hypothetical protein [Tepidisphaeraceae bacterium]
MSNQIIPIPKIPISIRPATLDDLPFIDGLQKIHTKQVGWMPTKQFEGKIRLGHVLVAEEVASGELLVASKEASDSSQLATSNQQPATRVGYCIGNDQYFKRDDVGIIYQMNVVPGKQRGFVGAMLLKAMFDRAAYGCRLFCCWCAQDIEANRFWEAMGFVPLAFRTGSAKRGSKGGGRVHIFWQKRIRQGDETTPYWFPSQTGGGSIREDRLVLPIPPGTHWSDAKPIVLPSGESSEMKVLGAEKKTRSKRAKQAESDAQNSPRLRALGGWSFNPPAPLKTETSKMKRSGGTPKPRVKNDPKLVAAARELRDRWMEHANAHSEALLSHGKYEVSRQLEQAPSEQRKMPLLEAA